jgi:SAM-dependent methyltransferase
MNKNYHNTHFLEDPKRATLWKALWNFYFRHHITLEDTVLDIGCGYGNFINNVESKNRIAIDKWPDFKKYLDPEVQAIVGDIIDIKCIDDSSIDFAFASNVFEHISQTQLSEFLTSLKRKLSSRGQLVILQPNYRYCASEYFDDYTHISIWSHVSLKNFLIANGYNVTLILPRFLPLTIKSRFPVIPQLIAMYLKSPFKPFGKQMLLFARPE